MGEVLFAEEEGLGAVVVGHIVISQKLVVDGQEVCGKDEEGGGELLCIFVFVHLLVDEDGDFADDLVEDGF